MMMKKIKDFDWSFLFKVLVLLFSIIALAFNYQSLTNAEKSLENAKAKLFKSRIYVHSTYLLAREDNKLQDDIEPNLNEEFKEEDMRSCWLTDEQIWMIERLSNYEYKILRKNCMIEKINPSNKTWYVWEISI